MRERERERERENPFYPPKREEGGKSASISCFFPFLSLEDPPDITIRLSVALKGNFAF